MEQQDHDELQRELAAYPAILPEETLREMEREYHLTCAVECSHMEFMEFDEHTPLFFGLLLREVKRLRAIEQEQPTIVCLCGSTRFSEAFHEANLTETLAGRIVLSIGCDFKSDRDLLLAGELTEADKERLDELHLRKVDLASEILVLNVNGYIGESTRREIEYAEAHGKRVRYLEHKMSS